MAREVVGRCCSQVTPILLLGAHGGLCVVPAVGGFGLQSQPFLPSIHPSSHFCSFIIFLFEVLFINFGNYKSAMYSFAWCIHTKLKKGHRDLPTPIPTSALGPFHAFPGPRSKYHTQLGSCYRFCFVGFFLFVF